MLRRKAVKKSNNEGQDDTSENKSTDSEVEAEEGVKSEHIKYQQYSTSPQPKKAPGFLTTREIGKHYLPRERYLSVCIREMIIFFLFLAVVALLAAGHRSKSEYYLSRVMTNLFVESKFKTLSTSEIISFNDINTLEQIWEYFNFYLMYTYWDYWYSYSDKIDSVVDEDKGIFFENKFIGRPRVRQLRVRPDSCTVPEDFQLMFANCYAEYSSSSESKETYGPGNGTEWEYHSPDELEALPLTGEISTYGGGGYYFDFGESLEETNKTIRSLFQNLWLDRGSRALILQFTTYNINENIFFTLQLLLEMPPTGGVLPYYKIHVEKFLSREYWDTVLLVFTAILALFILMYTVEEVYEILYFKLYYFSSFWNVLDLVILMFGYITLGFFLYSYIVVKNEIEDLIVEHADEHACFDNVNNARNNYVTCLAILFFFAAIKVLKYLNFNHSMHQMQTTLSKATKDIACFSVIFFIVFITFAQLGHLLFGSQVKDFRSFVSSVFALLRTAVGDFDYHKIENVNHFLGPIYFFAYIFFIYFILVNMFLAIIIDTYAEVRTSIRDQTKELHTGDVIGRWLRKLLKCIGCGRFVAKSDQQQTTRAGPSPHEDIQNLLRRCGFTEMEIDLFFAKFNIPRDIPLSQEEMRNKLLANLQSNAETVKVTPEGQERDELGESLMARIRVLEDNITEVNYKIDLIDNKIDAIQQIRARRRTAQPPDT